MDATASRQEIEDLVGCCLEDSATAPGRPSAAFVDPVAGPGRVRALLLLVAHGFPCELMPEVLGCCADDVTVALEVVRRRLPDAASVSRFLRARARGGGETPAGEDVKVSESAEVALETLHYWTDIWLDDNDAEIERRSGEPEL